MEENKNYQEKKAKSSNGAPMLFVVILVFLASAGSFIAMGTLFPDGPDSAGGALLLVLGSLLIALGILLSRGLKIVNPQEAIVLVLFGKYFGTIKNEGFYWVNPFCTCMTPAASSSSSAPGSRSATYAESKKLSLKTMTLNNEKQTVNDELGNPIIIGTIVIWRVVDTTRALFSVNNYKTFLSIQCDSAIRNVTRLYPYDVSDGSDEKTLRGSSQEVADMLKNDLQSRVEIAGLEVMEVRITHLSYAPEIAAAMLQRQQAEAIIAARQKIVEGAVSMVEMALKKLSENDVVTLDDERKAAMVSNLLVVLCGNKDAQPIVNSGSIY